jgi:PAS domain S-box-containing protein
MEEAEIHQHLGKIINAMNDGLMLIGTDGTIIMVNQAFEHLTGYSLDEVRGRPCTLLNCDGCEKTLQTGNSAWCMLFEQGQDLRKRCMVMKKNGTYLPVLKSASLLRDDQGALIGSVETLTDISEIERCEEEVHLLSRQLDMEDGFYGIVGKSPAMQRVFEIIEKASQSDAPVIIYGQSGTGKELVARAVHQLGRRRDGPFVQLNCAALNESLLESELFGHVKGAFTGAYRHRQGRFEAAHRGDIFLDEIGDVPPAIQVKLLRVIETKQFERVGDHRPISVDVRIITATNKDLNDLIQQQRFREDLFFRINVIPIHLPPLVDRMEDIPPLTSVFISRLKYRTGKKINGLTPAAMESCMAYHWPGNVRELRSALEYAFVISEEGPINVDHLPPHITETRQAGRREPAGEPGGDRAAREALVRALRESKGNQSQAARILGISRVTVWNRMRKYGIDLKKVMTPPSP